MQHKETVDALRGRIEQLKDSISSAIIGGKKEDLKATIKKLIVDAKHVRLGYDDRMELEYLGKNVDIVEQFVFAFKNGTVDLRELSNKCWGLELGFEHFSVATLAVCGDFDLKIEGWAMRVPPDVDMVAMTRRVLVVLHNWRFDLDWPIRRR